MENKICQNCKGKFVIEKEDFNFYQKIKVPPPTFCPECRLIRRLAYREDRPLYKDKCDKCDKDIISIFSPESPFIVYCSSCWWKDDWDAISYGKDYDFNKPFLNNFMNYKKLFLVKRFTQRIQLMINFLMEIFVVKIVPSLLMVSSLLIVIIAKPQFFLAIL